MSDLVTIDEIERTATLISKSTTISPELRGKVADIAVTIMAGRELGLGPMAALRLIHVVKNKPVLSADAMRGLVHSSGKCVFFECLESSDKIATYETQRVGSRSPQKLSFTIEQAKRAGLSGDNWTRYPEAMLRARASAALARDVYGDVLAGVYTDDEVHEFAEPAPAMRPVIIDAQVIEPDAKELLALVSAAQSKSDLDAMTPTLAKLPAGDTRDEIRALYKQKLEQFKRLQPTAESKPTVSIEA